MNLRRSVLVTVLLVALASAPGAALAGDDLTADGTADRSTSSHVAVADLTGSTVTTNTTDETTENTTATVGDATENSTVDGTTDGTTVDDATGNTTVDDATENTTVDDATGNTTVDETTENTTTTVDETTENATVDDGTTAVGDAVGTTADADSLADTSGDVAGQNGSVSAGLAGEWTSGESADGRGDTGESSTPRAEADVSARAESNASAAGASGVDAAPLGPFGDHGGEVPVTGGAAVGASAVGVGLLARRTGVLSGIQPVAGPAASSVAHAASILPEWTRSRFWRLIALGGYQRYADDDPLEHDTRADIYEYLAASPGSYLTEISEETGVALSTVRYHVRILAFENLVRDVDLRGKRRYFPLGTDPNELDAALNDDAPAAVLETLARQGPDSVSGLAEKLDRDPSTVTHHLQRLEEDGLVERERDGRSVINRAVPAVQAAFEAPVGGTDATAGGVNADAD